MRVVIFLTYFGIVIVLAAGVLTGCQSVNIDPELTEHVDARGRARSLALDSRKMQGIVDSQDIQKYQLPWYAARNDMKPAAIAGYEGVTYERSDSYTVDREYSHGGHVYQHFSRTTRSRQTTESFQ